MILLLGCTLGLGLVLASSPMLWPAGRDRLTRTGHGMFSRLRERLTQAGIVSVSVPTFLVVSIIVGAAGAAIAFAFVRVIAGGCRRICCVRFANRHRELACQTATAFPQSCLAGRRRSPGLGASVRSRFA